MRMRRSIHFNMLLTAGEAQMLYDLSASHERTYGTPMPRAEVLRRLLRDAYHREFGKVLTKKRERKTAP